MNVKEFLSTHPELEERDAPVWLQDVFDQYVAEESGILHADDDRDELWNRFIEEHE